MTHFTALKGVTDVADARNVAASYAYSRPRINAAVVALAVDGVPRPEIARMTGLTKQGVRMILMREGRRSPE